ncbi:hypothetical protein DPX16_14219 [Anabarilius grahami]|uniref:Uncharacterized protein n=1 Tax=Anabarilius grahami TaxID=495550 RepID=A0A3N0XF39_ANAGA|nr:hypothetical protein DPX16_14219 [Anabarilius grahami]
MEETMQEHHSSTEGGNSATNILRAHYTDGGWSNRKTVQRTTTKQIIHKGFTPDTAHTIYKGFTPDTAYTIHKGFTPIAVVSQPAQAAVTLSLHAPASPGVLSCLHGNYWNEKQVFVICIQPAHSPRVSWRSPPLQTPLNHAPLATFDFCSFYELKIKRTHNQRCCLQWM